MVSSEEALKIFSEWYYSHAIKKSSGEPIKGTLGGALIVLEQLKQDFSLDITDHMAPKGTQVKGASGQAVKAILARFGEVRRFVAEGGRTNRGLKAAMEAMLAALSTTDLASLTEAERQRVLESYQSFLVARVSDFFDQQRLELIYDGRKTAWETVHNILDIAAQKNKAGQVAEYLVGAKLQLRFPGLEIRNKRYSTADEQQDEPGDFTVNDTVFHVTMSPLPGLYEKCRRNLETGFRVFVLVPYGLLAGAKQNTDLIALGQITVQDIEGFVSQNIEELSAFSGDRLAGGFYHLLKTYNRRVEQVEIDKSVMISIPENLNRYADNTST